MFGSADAAGLIDEMGEAARAESVAVARRLAAVAQLYERRRREYQEAQFFLTDVYEAVAAEVSAAQNISRARAHSQVRMAVWLHRRLARVAEVFARGEIDLRLLQLVITRTDNVEDSAIAAVDEALAERVAKWMRWSKPKQRDRLDLWVAKMDPDGVRVPPIAKDNRYFDFEPHVPGLAFAGGVLTALDAAALEQRLAALSSTVCAKDPRTPGQLRADACGALARSEDTLGCQCGNEDCPAAAVGRSAAQVVVHVLAEQATLDGRSDQPGYLSGFGVLPAEEVRTAAAEAKLKPVRLPGVDPEPGYRPSAALADFLQWRDLTCRFPGCHAPVAFCDIDHTKPWPFGATHPSGLKHYCRTHHLLKTFFTGPTGWTDTQLDDGTIVFTAPTGHTYTTEPHGGVLFPTLATPTAPLPATTAPDDAPGKTVMMPRRRTTRDQDRQQRIARERRQRQALDAEEERQYQAWLAETYEPPPF
ncbi:HNH endonuclease [Mycobacterium sp. Y57]|uniref:HNH endonuclease signature motif containing protein n=1 Tax=Mycolicibacterium xanthum TaxID=2796469 RepID=UPI001C8561FA|nr:HNH endonuclease signature motif containing protein [Mycolicibacterium xanthum]MBX7435344.1 HNH endonuclease [Mycolicibacterium xanthum]